MPTPIAVGIDLGTTFSVVAWVNQQGQTEVLRNSEGDLLTPSAVLFEDARVIVGKEARTALGVHPDWVAQWVKRDMGAPVYSRLVRGERLPPEVIQSCILRKLRTSIVHKLGPDVRMVITVPAYFDETRRKATSDAGEMAGLEFLDIVNEPTAASLAFGERLGYLSPRGGAAEPMTVLVYDLGGGTFDVTLIRLAPGEIRAVATDGDVMLGGHDWDLRLTNHVADEFEKIHGLDPREDLAGFNRLYNAVLEAKHTLSARSRATVRVDYAGQSAEISVSRQRFEELTADLLERTAYTTRQLIAAAARDWSDVSRVLLVGGATRMPMVERMLTELTGLVPDRTVNPDEAVARGAALYAHYRLSKDEERSGGSRAAFEVVNINAHSLGVEGIDPQTLRKTNIVLIRRNTPLPATATERFTTKAQNQRSIVIRVLEGESTVPEECTAIGRTTLHDLPAGLPKGWPVDVSFQYATNGRLAVRAVVPGTHREVSLEFQRESGLSREGVSRWREAVVSMAGFEAFEDAAEDEVDAELLPVGSTPDSVDRAGESDEQLPTRAEPASGPSQPATGARSASPASAEPAPTSGQRTPHSPPAQPGSSNSLWIVNVAGYIISALVGLVVGYLLISWLFPEADLFRLLR